MYQICVGMAVMDQANLYIESGSVPKAICAEVICFQNNMCWINANIPFCPVAFLLGRKLNGITSQVNSIGLTCLLLNTYPMETGELTQRIFRFDMNGICCYKSWIVNTLFSSCLNIFYVCLFVYMSISFLYYWRSHLLSETFWNWDPDNECGDALLVIESLLMIC